MEGRDSPDKRNNICAKIRITTEGVTHMRVDLKAIDRCDGPNCGAAARAIAEFMSGELLFCGHHWRKHREAIVDTAVNYFVEPEHEDFTIQKNTKEMSEVA